MYLIIELITSYGSATAFERIGFPPIARLDANPRMCQRVATRSKMFKPKSKIVEDGMFGMDPL